MIVVESIPLFRSKAPVAAGVAAKTSEPAHKPPLPLELWVAGIPTLAAALETQHRIAAQHKTVMGKEEGGYYVRCPGWRGLLN